LNGQCKRLINRHGLEIRSEMSIGCHGAEQFFGNLGHVDRGVDLRDIFPEIRPLESDQMVHVDMGDEEHRTRVIMRFERVDRNERILFQDAVVRAHRVVSYCSTTQYKDK
jgi:hypothetical protein